MEKKKSFNLITLIFIGILCVLAIVVGFAINKINAEKEVAKVDKQQVENEIQEDKNTKNEIQNTGISQETESENVVPEIDSEEEKFSHLKIDPDKEFVFSKEHVSYGENDGYTQLTLEVINLNIEGIEKINSKIEDLYNKNKVFYSNALEGKNPDTYWPLPSLGCDYELINNILDVSFRYSSKDESNVEIYHIDLEKQKIISNEEYFDALGIKKENLEYLINDCFLNSYYNESSFSSEFNEKYKDFESFKNDIIYTNENKTVSENYKYDFKKICDFCKIEYSKVNNTIEIYGISTPIIVATDVPIILDSITIELDKKYVFSKSYNYELFTNPGSNFSRKWEYMPIINLNSNDAKKVNKDLEDYYKKMVNTVEKNGGSIIISPVDVENVTINGQEITLRNELILNKEGKVVIDEYYTMKFSHMIFNEKILSVIVELGVNTYSNLAVEGLEDNPKIVIYNFDIETGKLLSNEEFLEMCEIKLDTFKEKLDERVEDYNINDLRITFEDPSKLLYESNYYKFEDRIQEVKKLVVLGENFPNFPYTWITIDIENTNNNFEDTNN